MMDSDLPTGAPPDTGGIAVSVLARVPRTDSGTPTLRVGDRHAERGGTRPGPPGRAYLPISVSRRFWFSTGIPAAVAAAKSVS